MKILFLTPYYPPEVGAPQTRQHELAVRLVQDGHEVEVLTCWPNYPSGVVQDGYRDKLFKWEEREGVRVYRTWMYATPNRGFLRRVLAQLSFAGAAILSGVRMGPADVVVVESPPLFDGLAGAWLAWRRKARMVFNVADLWPESVVALGAVRNRVLIGLAEALEEWCYRRAWRILAVTRGIERTLRTRGWSKVRFLPNGVDLARFAGADGRRVRARMGWDDDAVVVLYAGTLGMSQALDKALEAAGMLEDLPAFRLVLMGDGAEREALLAAAGPNVRILPPVPRDEVPEWLAAADVLFISLKDIPLFNGAVPSKTYEAMAAGRPIVMAARGEAPALLEEAGGGVVVPPEDPVALAAAWRRLVEDPGLRRTLGGKAEAIIRARYDRAALSRRFAAIMAGDDPDADVAS
ncbi:MAG: glycosyltransferase family 4 protein [Candidatus Sericytochromatia bacterium]|nr:glycosyltransferase family 4 protein [Candidatus Sericytochromatia bacterium]